MFEALGVRDENDIIVIVLAGCTSVAKPTIHLHSNGINEAKLTSLRTKLEKSGYTVINSNQDFSHFLFTPLIVVPKNSKLNTPELRQQITDTLGSIPIVKRGNFKNHKYSGGHIGVYLRANNAT